MKIVFYTNTSGRSPVTEFIDGQSSLEQVIISAGLEELATNGLAAKGVFMKKKKDKTLQSYLKEKSKNKEFRLAYEEVKMHLKIANLIEKLRLKSGMTQAKLAQKAHVSQPMVARLEMGDQDRIPTLSTINKVFRALGHEVELNIKKIV